MEDFADRVVPQDGSEDESRIPDFFNPGKATPSPELASKPDGRFKFKARLRSQTSENGSMPSPAQPGNQVPGKLSSH